MTADKFKFFRDPIYGYIDVDSRYLKVIDSPFFQRLRHIKQLAFTDLVYHGAEHSRFGHSLGTYHLATVIANQIGRKKEMRDNFCLAALLHDVGHPPYSHAFESVLEETYAHSTHEDYTEAIIMNTEIGDFIDDIGADKKIVVKLIKGRFIDKPEFAYLNDLLSSELDLDRMDFLLRDSYYCGVPYGTYDIDRLLLSLTLHENEIVVQEKGRHAVESFILSRFYMYTQVYTHRTRRAFDIMLKAVFTKDIMKNIDYPKATSRRDINRLLEFDDAWLLNQIKEISKGKGTEAEIAKLFVKREQIRAVLEKIAYYDVENKLTDLTFSRIDTLERFKKEFSRELKVDENLIFFDRPWKDLPFEKRYRQYSSLRGNETKTIKILLGKEARDIAFDESSLAYHLSRKLAQVIRIYTIKEKRKKLENAIIRRIPELKDLIVKKS
jgi:HD superfamily phosphohydrolase